MLVLFIYIYMNKHSLRISILKEIVKELLNPERTYPRFSNHGYRGSDEMVLFVCLLVFVFGGARPGSTQRLTVFL